MPAVPRTNLPQNLETVSLVSSADLARHYAQLTTDFNPIHLDPDFAADTPFGRPIIHGTMGLNLVVETIERTFGSRRPPSLEIDVRFSRPVPVGTTIRAGGTLREAETGTYDIFVETEAGERAVEGTCIVGPPDQRKTDEGEAAV